MTRQVLVSSLLLVAACADEPPSTPDASAPADAAPILDASSPDAGPALLMCDPTFADVQACGGDLVGQWRYIDVCGAPKALGNFLRACPAARIVRNEHTITGTAGFSADLTYGWRLDDAFEVAIEVPASCTDSTGGCAGFAFAVSLGLGQTVTCAERDAFCDCETTGTSEDHQIGRYTVLTATLTATRSDGRERDYYFCVDGDRGLYRRADDEIVFLIERRR